MLWKCCIQYASKFGKLATVATGLEKISFHSNSKEGQCQNVQTTAQLHSSHTRAKCCSKLSKPGFNSTWTMNFDIQPGFRKGRGTRNYPSQDSTVREPWTLIFNLDLEKAEEPEIKLLTSVGSLKKQGSYRKTSTSASLTMPKPLTVWITIICGKFWKRWENQIILHASWETCMQVKK